MTYTPPSGDAVAFSIPSGAYTAPAGSAVTLAFPLNDPTVNFSCASTLAIVATGLFPAEAVISTGSTAYFEHPYREFYIQSTSTPYFATSQRHFSISSASTPYFCFGAQVQIPATSALDFKIQDIEPRTYAIASVGAGAFVGESEVARAYIVAGRSRFYPGRGYIRDIRAVAKAATNALFRGAVVADSAFALSTHSLVSSVHATQRQAAFGVSSGAICEAASALAVPEASVFSAAGQSVFSPGAAHTNSKQIAIRASTTIAFIGQHTASSVLYSPSRTTAVFRTTAQHGRAFSISAASLFSGNTRAYMPVAATVFSASEASFYGLKSVQGVFSVPAGATPEFRSAYSYSPIAGLPVDANLVYVFTKVPTATATTT